MSQEKETPKRNPDKPQIMKAQVPPGRTLPAAPKKKPARTPQGPIRSQPPPERTPPPKSPPPKK